MTMRKSIIRVRNSKGEGWLTVAESCAESMAASYQKILRKSEPDTEVEIFKSGRVPFADLPVDMQKKVSEILDAFTECYVEYSGGKFTASAALALRSSYPHDDFLAGAYRKTGGEITVRAI